MVLSYPCGLNRGWKVGRPNQEDLSENTSALDLELSTTVSDVARVRKEVGRLNARVGQMTSTHKTGSSHSPCSGGCETCAHAHEVIHRQDDVFAAMCGEGRGIEAELKRSISQAATIATLEETLLHMRRERFFRQLRLATAVDQTTQTSAATASIPEDVVDSCGTRQTGAGTDHVQEDITQDNGDGRWV